MSHSRAQLRRVHTRVEKNLRSELPQSSDPNDEFDALLPPAPTGPMRPETGSDAQLPGNGHQVRSEFG